MNSFEKKIVDVFVKNHSMALLQEAAEVATQMKEVADPNQLREREMALSSMYRFVYLALREYHDALSRNLSGHGIALPDLDTLIFDD